LYSLIVRSLPWSHSSCEHYYSRATPTALGAPGRAVARRHRVPPERRPARHRLRRIGPAHRATALPSRDRAGGPDIPHHGRLDFGVTAHAIPAFSACRRHGFRRSGSSGSWASTWSVAAWPRGPPARDQGARPGVWVRQPPRCNGPTCCSGNGAWSMPGSGTRRQASTLVTAAMGELRELLALPVVRFSSSLPAATEPPRDIRLSGRWAG
jgi:hypothetical protein